MPTERPIFAALGRCEARPRTARAATALPVTASNVSTEARKALAARGQHTVGERNAITQNRPEGGRSWRDRHEAGASRS